MNIPAAMTVSVGIPTFETRYGAYPFPMPVKSQFVIASLGFILFSLVTIQDNTVAVVLKGRREGYAIYFLTKCLEHAFVAIQRLSHHPPNP